jgi:AAA15 family ATPase/GTPase
MKLIIGNYRNFPLSNPIEIDFKEGITFILGINNVGKSNLLRFLFDFRVFFKSYESNILSTDNFSFVNAPFYFDAILNRTSGCEFIKFEIVESNYSVKFTMSPNISGIIHTNSFLVKVEHFGYNERSIEGQDFLKRVCSFLTETFYIGPTRTIIQNSSGSNYDILIGQDFINTWVDWADGDDVMKRRKMKVLIDDLKEFFNFKNFNIRSNRQRNNLLITTDFGEFLLTEMGTGIAHFIVVLANILITSPRLVLIDEPEQNLHPRLQELFIRTIGTNVGFGVIATSHSVGLARSTADSIYSFTSINGVPRITPFGNHFSITISQTISEMRYSQFVEIGGNNILLVEGRTDVKSFREILRKFGIENRFVIISFGGSQFLTGDKTKIVDELAELKRLNANSISVIFDSERRESGAKLKKEFNTFIEVCDDLGFAHFATDFHTTENYISQSAIFKVLQIDIPALEPYESFNERKGNLRWPKEKNWLMFFEMNRNEFEGTLLYDFIVNKLVPLAS